MRETIGRDTTIRHSLQPIVANRRGRIQAFFDVTGFELDLAVLRAARLRGGVAPDTGEAIGLQLHPHR